MRHNPSPDATPRMGYRSDHPPPAPLRRPFPRRACCCGNGEYEGALPRHKRRTSHNHDADVEPEGVRCRLSPPPLTLSRSSSLPLSRTSSSSPSARVPSPQPSLSLSSPSFSISRGDCCGRMCFGVACDIPLHVVGSSLTYCRPPSQPKRPLQSVRRKLELREHDGGLMISDLPKSGDGCRLTGNYGEQR
jgi:hypothetical protein